jgi:uncharacterized hydrophobic protein (TIGR00271 family)
MESAPTPIAAFSFHAWLERLLGIRSEHKPKVYFQISQSAEVADLNYWLELLLSAGIATLGLVLNSAAVVIGAMLISPLMGPIIAAGLALAAGDLYLGVKALLNIAASVAGAVLFSAGLVWLIPFQVPTAEILSRTQPNLLDLGVAILSGLAGSLIVSRGRGGDGAAALPGVAIAVALMPPLCTVGFGLGAGFQLPIMSGAALLFVTNLVAIVSSAFLVFLLLKMDAQETRAEINRMLAAASSADRLYRLLDHTRLSKSLARVGKLHWRILMPLLVLLSLFVPLSKALLQVRDETVARSAIRDAIRRVAPAETILSQQIDLGPPIRIRLILTEAVGRARVEEAQRSILKRTGKDVDLRIRKVAGEEELALLRERLAKPAPVLAPIQTLEVIRADVLGRFETPLKEIWPSDRAALLDYDLALGTQAIVAHVRYQAEKPLDPIAEEMVGRLLRARLGIDQLGLELQNVPPARQAQPQKRQKR